MLPSNWYDNSVCKECEYGERVAIGVICAMTQGLVPVGYQGCKAQNDYFEDLRKDEQGMTLTELAKELRKTFKFRYLAYGEMFYWGRSHNVLWISGKPLTLVVRDEGGEGVPCYIYEWEGEDIIETFSKDDLVYPLDLSEYADEDGEIDYSKCIVEVEE